MSDNTFVVVIESSYSETLRTHSRHSTAHWIEKRKTFNLSVCGFEQDCAFRLELCYYNESYDTVPTPTGNNDKLFRIISNISRKDEDDVEYVDYELQMETLSSKQSKQHMCFSFIQSVEEGEDIVLGYSDPMWVVSKGKQIESRRNPPTKKKHTKKRKSPSKDEANLDENDDSSSWKMTQSQYDDMMQRINRMETEQRQRRLDRLDIYVNDKPAISRRTKPKVEDSGETSPQYVAYESENVVATPAILSRNNSISNVAPYEYPTTTRFETPIATPIGTQVHTTLNSLLNLHRQCDETTFNFEVGRCDHTQLSQLVTSLQSCFAIKKEN